MKYLECDKDIVVVWHWIDCGSLNLSVFLYFAGMWHVLLYRFTDLLLVMSHQLCANGYAYSSCL